MDADNLTPNTAEAIEFLKRWPCAFPHLTAVFIDPKGNKGKVEARAFPTPVDWVAVAHWIEERQGIANLYFAVNSLSRPLHKKAAKDDVAEVVAFHVDIDVPDGEDQAATATTLCQWVQDHEPRPSVVIYSGGGAQAFWILEQGQRLSIAGDRNEAENAERYTRGLEDSFSEQRGAKADKCHNVDRVMRLPGTINIPDVKKLAKGRGKAMARLIEFNGLTYPLSTFTPAAAKGEASSAGSVEPAATGSINKSMAAKTGEKVSRIKVDISWEGARDLYRTLDIDKLRARGVEDQALLSLQYGDNLSILHEKHVKIGHRITEGPYTSFSDIPMALATAFLKAGLTPEECAAVMCDTAFGGNKHITKIVSDKEKHRAILRCLEYAAGGLEQRAARERASRAGIPLWRDCYDDAGLHPVANLANAEIAVGSIGVEFALDLWHHVIVAKYAGESEEIRPLIGEVTDLRLRKIRSLCNDKFLFDPGEKNIYDAVWNLAMRHAFDPVLDYLNGLQWDGVKRLDTWGTTYMSVEDTPLNRAIGASTLKAAVRRARKPGCKYDCILVLEGKEGTMKSTVVRELAGAPGGDTYFSDQTILNVSDKEAQELLHGVWMFECADLSGMARADIERTKAFASRQTDRARRAFGRAVEAQPRRCIILATTNDTEYLLSQTGNRRFLPWATGHIDIEALLRDRDQLWAEAAAREATGEPIELDPALWAEARAAQEERRAVDPWEASLQIMPRSVSYYDGIGRQEVRVLWEHGDRQCVASTVVLEHVLRLPRAQQSTAHGKRLAVVMARLGWQRQKNGLIRIGKDDVRGYFRAIPEGTEPLGGAGAGKDAEASGAESSPSGGGVAADRSAGGEGTLALGLGQGASGEQIPF